MIIFKVSVAGLDSYFYEETDAREFMAVQRGLVNPTIEQIMVQ